jgi:hypothetical protein
MRSAKTQSRWQTEAGRDRANGEERASGHKKREPINGSLVANRIK